MKLLKREVASARMLPVTMALLMIAGGCTVGPDFVRPRTSVPKTYVPATTRPATQAAGADLRQWWSVFNDPTLTALIEAAFASNLDMRLAESRIRQARASRGVAVSGLGPTLDTNYSIQRGRAAGDTTKQYQAGFDAGWEIDVFGGVRRGIEAADAQLQASVEDRRDMLVTLAAEVARNYVDLRAYQQRLAITIKNLQSQQKTADLTRRRFEGGFVSGLDVANATAQVATTAGQVPLLESSARQTINALSVLLDRDSESMIRLLSKPAAIPASPPAVPHGVPSDLLRRRPDIRRAEADIHAATANIGVAAADLFPKFSIGGSLGWRSGDAHSLFSPLSKFWSLGPSVSWNLFQSGRTLSNIEVQKMLQEQAVLTYRKTVLTAVQEVENALVAGAKEQEHYHSLETAVAANRRATELSMQLYTQGRTDFLNVLTSQRSLYVTEEAMAQSTQTLATDLIALYKALGGGWQRPD
ncbi:MAG: efflux transporter outer membrane subunit [Planctomycetaceae bacterium]|nr:efflux transporter outer membrane subunit [Planctomycetaceae bacterium]